ncbi:MAG: hypothetical protein AAF611_13370 [Bacteroidota bacterium]
MKNLVCLITLFFTICTFGQEEKESLLLTFDDSWRKEILPMPLSFAPQIPLKGVEEVRFSKGWAQKDSDTFWTYAFVWNVNLNEMLTTKTLELYMQYYFDGLMGVVNKDKSKTVPKTIALFLKEDDTKETAHFIGKIQLYDAFHTKDMTTLNCSVRQVYCAEKQKSFVLFHFSPQEFAHATWDELYTVALKEKPCKL